MRTTIGIDPGLGGALAIICPETVTLHPTPTFTTQVAARRTKTPKADAPPKTKQRTTRTKQHYALPEMRALLEGLDSPHCFIEAAQVRRDQHPTAALMAGVGFGTWIGLLAGLGIPCEVVHPRVWQNAMFQVPAHGDPKGASILSAQRLFPAVSLLRTERCRVPDDNLADALLIAEYGRRRLREGL